MPLLSQVRPPWRPEYEEARSEAEGRRRQADDDAKQVTQQREAKLRGLLADIRRLSEECQASPEGNRDAVRARLDEAQKQARALANEVRAAVRAGAPPTGACDYGNPRFWEEAYERGDGEADEWYFPLTYMLDKMPPLNQLPSIAANKEPQCLVLGCGKSTASELMHKHGYGHIVGVDVAKSAIRAMREQHRGNQSLVYLAMDICKGGTATLKDASFDVVFDKGTLDAIFCTERGAFHLASAALSETARLLRPGGYFVLVTHSDRADWLCDEKYQWDVNLLRLDPPAPPEGSPDARLGDNYKHFKYYVFHCVKRVTKVPPPAPVTTSARSTSSSSTTVDSACGPDDTGGTVRFASARSATTTSTSSSSSTSSTTTTGNPAPQTVVLRGPPAAKARADMILRIARALVAFAFHKYHCACDVDEMMTTAKSVEERAYKVSGGMGIRFDAKMYRFIASKMTLACCQSLFAQGLK